MQSRQRAFTLVELLVVISIIALLASMALPAMSGAMQTAKKAKANAMISQLKVAITAFNTEYGSWPMADKGGEKLDNKQLYRILTATEGGVGAPAPSDAYNTRNIPFIEFTSKDLDNSTNPTMFVDPWYLSVGKKDEQNYNVLIDYDYDNVIKDIPTGTGANGGINAGVAIWDPGVPKGTTVNDDTTKYLRSW